MRIGINAYSLAKEFSGTSIYLYNLIRYLVVLDKKNEYFLYCRPGINLPFAKSPNWHIVTIEGFFNKSSTFWTLTSAKRHIIRDGIDVFWATENILPLNLPQKVKKVLTVYDLVWHYYPQLLNFDNLFILPFFADKSIRGADFILTLTDAIAEDIKRIFKIPAENISTVHLGVSEEFQPFPKEEAWGVISVKYGVSSKYILFVSNIEPKKNIVNLLKAFYILKNKYGAGEQLLLAGGKRWNDRGIYRAYKKLGFTESQVKFLGYVDFADLAKLYCGAQSFILPSFYEGFGLPPLEAMACGTPVVVSDIPVFREVLADAALFVDPHNPEHIASTLHKLLTDKSLAEELRQKGVARSKLFSWENAVKGILSLFNEIGSKDDNLG